MSDIGFPRARASSTSDAASAGPDARGGPRSPEPAPGPGPAPAPGPGELVGLGLRALGALAVLGAIATVVDRTFHDELEAVAPRVVDGLGASGVGLGALLADGFHVPVPPQAYLVAIVADGRAPAPFLAAMCVGSLVGGALAYVLASWAAGFAPIRSRVAGVTARLVALRRRFGARAMLVAALLPVPYSFLCYAAGLARFPRRDVALLLALRVPKLLAYYAVVLLALRFR